MSKPLVPFMMATPWGHGPAVSVLEPPWDLSFLLRWEASRLPSSLDAKSYPFNSGCFLIASFSA